MTETLNRLRLSFGMAPLPSPPRVPSELATVVKETNRLLDDLGNQRRESARLLQLLLEGSMPETRETFKELGYCDRTMDEAVAQWEESVAEWNLCLLPNGVRNLQELISGAEQGEQDKPMGKAVTRISLHLLEEALGFDSDDHIERIRQTWETECCREAELIVSSPRLAEVPEGAQYPSIKAVIIEGRVRFFPS